MRLLTSRNSGARVRGTNPAQGSHALLRHLVEFRAVLPPSALPQAPSFPRGGALLCPETL